MLEKISNKHAEGYIDICVGVVAFAMILVIAINIFAFINIRVELDTIAEELIEAATYSGEFGNTFLDRDYDLNEQYGDYSIDFGADEYFNYHLEKVQLGKKMWVTVSRDTYIKGLGIFKFPINVSVTRSGLSEKYWK